MAKQELSITTLADVLSTLAGITMETIDTELASIDAQIAETVRPLVERRSQLMSIKKMKNGQAMGRKRQQRKAKQKATESADTPKTALSLVNEIHAYLTASGSTKVQVIATQTGREYQTVYSCLNSNPHLFRKTGQAEFAVV